MRRMFTQIVGAIAAMTAFAGPACAMKPELVNAPAPISRDAEMNAYILLDRTGSMSSIWDEALNSVNVYAASLGTQEEDEIGDVDASVTLAVFDAQDGLNMTFCVNVHRPRTGRRSPMTKPHRAA